MLDIYYDMLDENTFCISIDQTEKPRPYRFSKGNETLIAVPFIEYHRNEDKFIIGENIYDNGGDYVETYYEGDKNCDLSKEELNIFETYKKFKAFLTL